METEGDAQKHDTGTSSYRTYEEWKLFGVETRGFSAASSYRTYEEWKLFSMFSSLISTICSYRTYEEWKLVLRILVRLSRLSVLTVPMRNGNRTDISDCVIEKPVLTVPMRNGNMGVWVVPCSHF